MGYRVYRTYEPVHPAVRKRAYVEPPMCRSAVHSGIPVKMRFTGHQGPLRNFQCPCCGRCTTVNVEA